jgi:fluoroquinolone transport system permease protein
MNRFVKTLKWDAVLLLKYGIVPIAIVISAIYCVVLWLSPISGMEKVVAVLIFSDPVMYGFLFTAVMLLFEKEALTHLALAVTPLPVKHFILSKTIVFTALALFCSTFIILSARPAHFYIVWFALGVILSSVLFVLVGIIGVSFVRNFNQFILLMPAVLAPACLPFLHYFDVVSWPWLYLLPTQACLILFSASVGTVETWQLIYAVTYLILSIGVCAHFAQKVYIKQLKKSVSHE